MLLVKLIYFVPKYHHVLELTQIMDKKTINADKKLSVPSKLAFV